MGTAVHPRHGADRYADASLFDLLDASPAARTGDPATSHEAAGVVAGQPRKRQAMRVLDALALFDGATAADLVGDRTGVTQQNVVSRRLTDLHTAGLAEPTDQVRNRCRVWRITDDGRRALREAAS